jgi:ribosome-binding factor A
MPREFLRSDRMAEQLRRELSDIVQGEIKDPRLGFFSFTEVRMSRDLSHAVVYTSVLEVEDEDPTQAGEDSSDADQFEANESKVNQLQETVDVLNRATGFIRKHIASRIQARIVPTLKFVADDSVSRGSEMDVLIQKALYSDKNK